jgi:thiamine-phosphate pyrophosphorylase
VSVIGPAPLVYLITDRHATGGRPLEQVVGLALRALSKPNLPKSAVAVQLREKDLDGRALLDLGHRLRVLTAAAGVRLFVNDRVDVAMAVGADGIHLGGGALSLDDVDAIAPGLQIAVSTHSVAQVERVAASGRVSFVVFGPVFDTPSKQRYGPPLGTRLLRQASTAPVPVVAIGGVDPTNAASCRMSGASGIACIRSVLRNHDPASVLTAFFEAIEST